MFYFKEKETLRIVTRDTEINIDLLESRIQEINKNLTGLVLKKVSEQEVSILESGPITQLFKKYPENIIVLSTDLLPFLQNAGLSLQNVQRAEVPVEKPIVEAIFPTNQVFAKKYSPRLVKSAEKPIRRF